MLGGKEVCRSIEVTDNVKMSDLSLSDQVRLILAAFSNNEDADLENAERLSRDRLRKIAALKSFVDKSIARMNELGKNKVTAKLSYEFLPYINDIRRMYGKFYDIKVIGEQQAELFQLPFIISLEKGVSKS